MNFHVCQDGELALPRSEFGKQQVLRKSALTLNGDKWPLAVSQESCDRAREERSKFRARMTHGRNVSRFAENRCGRHTMRRERKIISNLPEAEGPSLSAPKINDNEA